MGKMGACKLPAPKDLATSSSTDCPQVCAEITETFKKLERLEVSPTQNPSDSLVRGLWIQRAKSGSQPIYTTIPDIVLVTGQLKKLWDLFMSCWTLLILYYCYCCFGQFAEELQNTHAKSPSHIWQGKEAPGPRFLLLHPPLCEKVLLHI